VSTDRFVLRGSEHGTDWPEEEHYIEETPSFDTNQYRDTGYNTRVYGYELQTKATGSVSLATLRGNWNAWHNPELGEGYVHRVTLGGQTRCLDCIPNRPKWEDSTEGRGFQRKVSQTYEAANPWWRAATATTASGSFSHSQSMTVSFNNTGDIPSWPQFTITGIIKEPVISNLAGDSITVNKTTTSNSDEIRIDCRPNGSTRLSVKYYANGAGSGTPCQITSGSKYIRLPTGSHSVSLDATSGTASVVISAYNYFGDLY